MEPWRETVALRDRRCGVGRAIMATPWFEMKTDARRRAVGRRTLGGGSKADLRMVTNQLPLVRRKLGRRLITGLAAFGVLIGPQDRLALAQTSAPMLTRAEYEACQGRDEAGFRRAIEAVTGGGLKRGLQGVDYRAVVVDEWRKGGFDDVMNRRVDAVVDELRTETSWTDLLTSLASKETAQQLATAAAERVYRSDDIRRAVEEIANGVGREVGKRIELATADSAEPAIQCLQAFLGPRYGATIAGIVARDVEREFTLDPARTAASVTARQIIAEGREGIAGAVILVVRRQLANLATQIGHRIVGAVLGRLVAVVAGGVGVVLVAKDLWELRHGVLPIIASEMKSPATRDKVQDELARGIAEQIGEQTREISAKTADRVVEIWREFRRAHARVVELADRNDRFKQFIDTVRPQNLARLDETVGLVLASEGEPALLKRLENGTLYEAVERLPAPAFQIAREVRSLESGLRWQALAGDSLARVIEHELYRRNGPEEFTKAALVRLLSLDDRLAIARLAGLKGSVREPLLELDEGPLRKLARGLSESELQALSSYLTSLQSEARTRLLAAVTEQPARLRLVAPEGVREAILASRDQAAAIGMLLRADSVFDFVGFGQDVALVREGKVSPGVLWARYPIAIPFLAGLGVFAVLAFWRLIFGRRRRLVIETSSKG